VLPREIGVTVVVGEAEGRLVVKRKKETPKVRAKHGLVRALIANMVKGVREGWSRRLELVGTGYRVRMEGKDLVLSVGFSHPVKIVAEEGVEFRTEGETKIEVRGIDKQRVGEMAARIRRVRPPEPYKGKGIRYEGEVVRKKPGKAAKTGAAGG